MVKPLAGLKAVCYYGCLPVRPPKLTGIKDYENPMHMDRLLKQLGVEPIQWSYKTDCCGASLMVTRMDLFKQLIGKILTKAKETGADCVVVGCSMCQMNLDTRQEVVEKDLGKQLDLPILYYTELMGLAMGHRGCRQVVQAAFQRSHSDVECEGFDVVVEEVRSQKSEFRIGCRD